MKKSAELLIERQQLSNQIQANLARERTKYNKQDRNARTRELIIKGGILEKYLKNIDKDEIENLIEILSLVKKSGIASHDKNFLMGCFLAITKIEKEGKTFLQFKEKGKRFLNSNVES